MRFASILLAATACAALLTGREASAQASEWGVNLYGLAYHLERERAHRDGTDNEVNPGLGLRWRKPGSERYDWFADGGFYRDSGRNTAVFAGVGALWKPLPRVGLGGALTFFHSDTYNKGRPFIAPIPVLSVDAGPVSVNLAYAPRIGRINEVNTFGLWVTLWPGRW